MDNNLVLASIKAALPVFTRDIAYNSCDNMFVDKGWDSESGHFYQGGRRSDKLAICFDRATGHSQCFLNGVTLYGSDGHGGSVVLSSYKTPLYQGWFWSEFAAKEMSVMVLKDYISSQCVVVGGPIPSDQEIKRTAEEWYDETYAMTAQFGRMLQEHCVKGQIA